MDGGEFTGTRGMKVYTEGTPATAPSVEVKGTAFSGLTEKAAIVVSKAATVKFAEVSVADCSKGLFQKDIEGSLDDQKVTVTANGSKISGSFEITANREPETAKTEFNITGGMFTAEVPSDYCADGFTVKATTDADGNTVYGVVEEVVAATIDGTAYETLDEAITDVQDGKTIVVNAGEYKLNKSLTYTGKAFTIQAAEGAKVSFDMSAAVALHGAKITFSGVTFDYKTNKDYTGLQHADTLVYNDCTVNGKVFLYAASETFNRCTFVQEVEDYNVWTYGAKAVTFNGCTFNCVGKSVLVYNEGYNSKTELAVSDCEFKASASVEGKAAIEIDTSLMAGGATITVDAKTTAEGFAEGSNSKSTLWNDKKQKQDTNTNTTVTVAGETVFTPIVAKVGEKGYTTLAEALADVAEGKPLTWVAEGAWPVKTPVYYNGTFYETGTGFAAKGALERAIDAANAEGAAAVAKIYVRPGFEADELVLQAHQQLKTGLAIYGNDAKLSRNWAPCVEYPGTSGDSGAHQLTKDVSLAIYNLHNGAGFWGRRTTAYTVDLKLSGCRNAYQVMFYGNADTGVKGKTNISVTNCTFDATTKADHNVLVTIGAGTVDVSDTTFTAANINVKNVDGGDNVITVKNCTFKDTVAGNQNIRVRSYVEGTHADLTIENVTFAGDSTQNVEIGDSKAECKGVVNYTITKTSGTMNVYKQGVTTAEATTLDAAVAYSGDNVGTIADEKALRRAFFAAPTDGTAVTVTLGADITLETLYAAENFGTEKLDDNAEGDTFNRYKVGVHPTEEDPNHWNPLVTGQTQEQRLVYGAYYHMSATDERIARLVVKAGQKIVLDLNGHTIQKNARATHGDWSTVCTDIIGNYGTLEIKDSSTGTKGTIKGIGYISCQGAVLHNYAGATMTVTGVNVDGNAAGMEKGTGQYVVSNEGGTLTLDGVNVHDTATSASLIMSNGGTVTIKNATLSHPATKVINAKGGEINIESASVTSEEYAVFVTGDARVNVNGSLTIEGTGTLCVEGDAAALTKKPGVELSAPAGFTWVENDGVQVLKSFAAKVGKTEYMTLAEAIAVLSAENHTLTLLNENAWDATTPVYWAAGTQSGYAATLTAALTAAYKANAGAITIVCRPGADVGTMTHGHVADDLTIYGNDAYLSGGECDLEVDTYTFSRATGKQATDGVCLDKDITITAYELDNLGVWGDRHTAHMVTVNLTDCDGKAPEGNVQRVYISGTTGVNNITLTGCDFLTKATAVYSNADGAIKAVNCSFTDGQVPFNINHKANGKQTVAVENCTFTNCGDAAGDWKQFAAPLRLVNSGAGTQSAEVTGCAFAGTVGANGDILLGDGRTGQASNDVELKVVNTKANIQAQKPGYYGGETVDETKKATATSLASGTLETSVAKLLPVDPRTLGYATSGKAEALPATPDMNGEVVNVTAAQAQYVLDGAYGPIDGKTINFTESINDTLILGRASKYDGSKTVYRHGSHAGEALSYADFIAYKNQSGWTQSCYYERTVENVTFTAKEGVTVKNFEADGGAHIYAGTAPVYDYVRDTGSWVTEGSCYYKRAILKNITFKGLTFKAKTDINTSESTTVYDGFTFKDCTFDLGTTADGNQAIRYYNENNNGNVKNLVVEGCTFKTCSQGVYTAHVKNVTVTGSTFDTTGHNAIAIQDHNGPCDHGKVVITGNTFKNIGDRIIRFNNVGMGTTVTIKDNTADGNSGKLDEATGKREIVKATTLPVNAADSITASGNNWGANTVVEGVFIDDYATKLGTEACPYSREQFAAMTRADYITAQERLGGTLYVNVGNYAYEKDGVLGNGVRNDTPGQVPDHSKLNAYGENGYLGEKNDGANGHAVVFVGGTITSGVTGYTSIDSIGTSLLLAVPAYTKVTFKGTAFKNVLSFDYQLYTSPWSQLGGLTFNGCTFDGIIVGAIASQELAFNGCTFNNYVNTTSANSSNPTWIRPAYGNWTKGDNEGQGTDFRSLTKITFENNTVTSTRPVKFERIAQWEMATTVTATGNTFAITPQEGDKDEKKTKNVGLYFGANAKFDLVVDKNEKIGETAALYTAEYSAPNGGTYVGLPAGSTVKNTAGEEVATGDGDALAWKTTKKITLKTTTEVASVTNAEGVSVNFATLADAIAAAQAGETVTLLTDVESVSVTTVVAGKDIVLDLNGKTLTSTANGITIEATAKLTVKDSLTGGKVVATGKYSNAIENKGTLVIESGSFEAVYGAICALGGSTTTISGGTFASSAGHFGMYYWANGTALSVTVNGGLFKNSVSTAMENGKVALSIKGGSFATDLTDYCGADAGTYLDKETGLYVYGRESEHVPAGYVVDGNGNVTISDEESLFWFAQQVNVRGNTFKGKTVSLADDIALTAKWTPVGVSVAKSFQGTFDGKGHAITGMKVSGAYQAYGYGFFKLVISATVKNVTFTQAEVKGEYSNVVGCVAGYSYGSSTFENVHVTDSLVYAFGKVGGFVGMAEDAGATTTFRNCSVEATTIHGGYNVAGFCGLVMGTCAFSGSSLTDVTPVVDEDSQGFGKVVVLDTTVVCDGSVATCAGTGTSIKGRYIPNSGCYWSAYSDLYNHYGDSKHDCTLADGKILANSEVVHDAPVAIGDARYSDLQAAFDAAKTGDTVTLLSDITLTEQVNITKALDGLTLDGNGKTIICATTDDPLKSGGSALYFGNANDLLYCTGIKIKDLTMTGTARFAIFLCGGTTTEFTNVKISGNYYIAVNLYGTHGATMTNCDISNSTKGTNKYISAIWSNVASANPLTLNNSKVDVIAINTYTTANKLEPKIFVMDGSEVGEVHTFDDGSVSGNKKLCVSDGSTGSYVVKEYDEATSTWVNLRVAQIGTVGYETLEAALAAATDGDTITLLADVTVAEQLVVEKPLTLDLGGKTVTSTYAIPASLSSGEARYALLTKAPVTVTNGTFAAGQARALGAYANLTLTDATVTSELIGGHCCVAFCAAGGIYTVANATIKGDYAIANFAHNATIAITGSALEGSGCGLYHNGSNYGLKLTVSDTTINGAIDQAIGEGKDPSGVYLSGSLDVLANAENQNGAKGRHQATFTRCTIKGNTGVEVKYTDLTLEDCTVVATTEVPSYTQNNNGMAALGFAVVSTDNATGNATPKPEGTITITGADGSYTGLVGLGSLDSVKTGFADFEDAHYAVSGGTFSDAVLPEYCAAGFIPTANDDGTYGVKEGAYVAQIGSIGYETLEAALAAAKDGETVKLLADVTESVTIAADRTLTLDLNGKTLSAGKASEALTVTGHLTIDDTSAAKSGRVVGDGRYAVYMNNRTAHVGEAAVGGSLTLNAGSLEGATHGVYILANQAAFTMNGGKVSATQAESIRVNNDYHAKTISLLSGEVGDVFLGSISSTELTTLTVGKADQTDPAAVKVGKIGLQYNRGLFRLELYNGLVGELPEIGPSCTATYTALGMLVKSDANCPSGKVFEAIDYNGETWYRIAALQKIAITFDDSKTVALPFATDWLKAHVGEGEASWTTEALEEKAENELAKWQCYLFGLDPNKKDAKVVATAGQGTDEAIPLTVANADASASPLVTGGYVTVAYVLMGSNDGTAWTPVATSDKRDGLAIPLTGTTYKFYRVDVTVTSAEGN